jgi:hypothetical protein
LMIASRSLHLLYSRCSTASHSTVWWKVPGRWISCFVMTGSEVSSQTMVILARGLIYLIELN